MAVFSDHVLEDLYKWIDSIPLSRAKKDLKRDFSDGVLTAEIVKHFYPQHVDLHNYTSAQSLCKKTTNWRVLNRKVFRKMGFEMTNEIINSIVTCKPWAVEQFLHLLRERLRSYQSRRRAEVRLDSNCPLSVANVDHSGISSTGDSYTLACGQQSTAYEKDFGSKSVELSSKRIGDGMSSETGPRSSNRFPVRQPQTDKGHSIKPAVPQTSSLQGMRARNGKIPKLEPQYNAGKIQMLEAKVKHLEYLLHQRSLRVSDLQSRLCHRVSVSKESSAVGNQQQQQQRSERQLSPPSLAAAIATVALNNAVQTESSSLAESSSPPLASLTNSI